MVVRRQRFEIDRDNSLDFVNPRQNLGWRHRLPEISRVERVAVAKVLLNQREDLVGDVPRIYHDACGHREIALRERAYLERLRPIPRRLDRGDQGLEHVRIWLFSAGFTVERITMNLLRRSNQNGAP